ncbi:30S ribosomal protein S12 methylthiotransferase RimO, partial [bacterium]|nr:30S ribosomal protein S12 methylthiotransferase RimO [bacterium]
MGKSPATYSLITLGCPKNQADSDILEGQLLQAGLERIEDAAGADVILVNTCGFIEDAKEESIEAILEAVEIKKKDARKKVYVWGCLSERYRDRIRREIPEVDGFFGIEPYEQLVRLVAGGRFKWKESYSARRRSHAPHAAFLKIADGCDHACTFCAIPQFKGRFRSRSLKILVE